MGEYEERYPEVYGRDDEKGPRGPAREEVLRPGRPAPGAANRPAMAPAWQHVPSGDPARTVEPVPASGPVARRNFRGMGPRGYVRSPQRIYEDICDRLTDNPFVDASDIEVTVTGTEVQLNGRVASDTALLQAEAIAQEVAGVSHVHNQLTVRGAGERHETTAGDQVNRAMPYPGR